MKKKTPALLILAVIFTFVAASSVMATPITPITNLTLLGGPVIVGDTFDVEVTIDGNGIGQELLAFGFDVFDGSGTTFAYNSYTVDPGFMDTSFGINNVSGMAFTGIPENDVLITTLHFTALAVGSDTLSTIGLYDGAFSGLFYEIDGHDIVAELDIDVNPIPEPGTMLLLGSGLIGLAGYRKRLRK